MPLEKRQHFYFVPRSLKIHSINFTWPSLYLLLICVEKKSLLEFPHCLNQNSFVNIFSLNDTYSFDSKGLKGWIIKRTKDSGLQLRLRQWKKWSTKSSVTGCLRQSAASKLYLPQLPMSGTVILRWYQTLRIIVEQIWTELVRT